MKLITAVAFFTTILASCNSSDQSSRQSMDSVLIADSIRKAEIAIEEAKKTNPATFDFTGRWVGDIMTFVFSGDSAQLIVEGEENDEDWYRVDLDRAKDPIEMDFYTKFLREETLGFSMIVRIDGPETITIAFSDDMTVRPTSFDPNHSVTCIKRTN